MNEGKDNIIVQKSYAFALEIIKLYKVLVEKKEYVLSKQILRSGTSIGANIHEAVGSESKKDFIHKLGISVKEARETSYWLNLLKDSDYLSILEFERLIGLCEELIRILNSIILTTKERYFSNS
ncbi:MAG: four helix bundle protein [Chitinophagaceae bacterium]|nr:four helix bundle protein [Chitinophagaceae bacterium]